MSSPLLSREEYVEQAYFFRTYRERIDENVPAQEVLSSVAAELLATTKLPLAIEFLSGEMQLHGRIGAGMAKLTHYFSPFQAFVMQRAETEESRFDVRNALQLLEREAEHRSQSSEPQALFIYQFECLARHQLGYDEGLRVAAQDGAYNADWRAWIEGLRRQLGIRDFGDLIYARSQHLVDELRRQRHDDSIEAPEPVLFGAQEGRIAKAHRGKDPLHMFAALQRHLGYPSVPRPPRKPARPVFEPHVEVRFQRLEGRLALVESEVKDGIDLTQFYQQTNDPAARKKRPSGDRSS
ncbi:MAG: hypothetical protein KDA75_00495 [Planctomycetaceae bacterium]|nr:hypothetical protein [Planctomycetaceae bacterium]